MICANCGQAVAANDQFCDRCGAPLGAALPPSGPTLTMPVADHRYGYIDPYRDRGQTARLWAAGVHLSALVGAFAIFLGALIGPAVVYFMRHDFEPFIAENARQALNFNLSVLVYGVVLILGTIVTFGLGFLLTLPLGIVLGLAWVVLTLMAAVRAWNDGVFHYPFTIQFFK